MQQLNPSEISDIIKQRIEKLDVASEARNQGTIVSVSDGIVQIHGLADVMFGEMIEFPGGVFGMALNLERDSGGAVVLGDYLQLEEGMTAQCTGRILEVPVGPEMVGRVVDALGNPIDGKGPIDAKLTDAVEKVAPGVIAREPVDQPVIRTLRPSARLPAMCLTARSKTLTFSSRSSFSVCVFAQRGPTWASSATTRRLSASISLNGVSRMALALSSSAENALASR